MSALAVLWSLLLVGDYLGLKLLVDEYISNFSADQLDWIAATPLWLDVTWGIGVWSGMFAAILLALSAATGAFFALSFIGWALTLGGLMFLHAPGLIEVLGDFGLYKVAIATGAAFVFALYARWMHVRWRYGDR